MQIWIIDSRRLERSVVSEFLRDLGHNMSAFANGEALGLVFTEDGATPDVLIAAVQQTSGSGLRELQHATDLCPDIPIIVIADPGFTVPAGSNVSRQVHAFVRRPVQLEELEIVLGRLGRTR